MKPSSDQRTKRKHLLLILLGCMAWLMASGLCLWLMAPRWLPRLATETAASFGIQLEFEIDHLSLTEATLENLSIIVPGVEFTADQMIVTASPRDWTAGRLDSLLLRGGHAVIRPQEAPPGESDKPSAITAQSLEDWIKNGVADLPLRSMLLPDFKVTFAHEAEALSIELNASAVRNEENWNLAIHGRSGDASFHLLGERVEGQGLHKIECILNMPDPISWLAQLPASIRPSSSAQSGTLPFAEAGPLIARISWTAEGDRIDLVTNWSEVALNDGIKVGDLTLLAHSEDWLETVFVWLELDPLTVPNAGSISIRTKTIVHQPLSEARRVEIGFLTTSFPQTGTDENKVWFEPLQGSLEFGPGIRSTITLPLLKSPRVPIGLLNNLVKIETDGERWQASWTADMEGALQGLTIAGTGNPTGISLKASGSTDSDSLANIPEMELHLRPHSVAFTTEELSFAAVAEASLSVASENSTDTIPFSGKLRVDGTQFRWDSLRSDHASLGLQFQHHGLTWKPGSQLPSTATMLAGLQSSLELDASGFWGELPFSVSRLRAIKDSGSLPMALEADRLSWMQFQVDSLSGQLTAGEHRTELTLHGNSLNETLHLGLEALIPTAQDSPANRIGFFLQTPEAIEQSEFPLHTLTGTDAISWVKGHLKLRGTWLQSPDSQDLSLQGSFTGGSWSNPDSGASARGIEVAAFSIENLLSTPKGDDLEIAVAEISFAPVQIQNLNLQVRFLPDLSIEVIHCQFTMAQGRFALDFQEPIPAPYHSTRMIVRFSEVELLQIIHMFPDFHDHIEGIIEGEIPITLAEGRLSWDAGYAKLMPGQSGKLIMSDQGFLAPHIPPIIIDAKTNTDIRSALREISLSEIFLNLQGSTTFDAPSVLTLSGISLDPKVAVPIERIQFNIRAPDLPDLINQGLNWKHGMPAFNLKP
jgi:hypothetical protein